jgi:hypothetical protein
MFAFALFVPPVLLVLALIMQRVEQPLQDRAVGDRVVEVLRQGHADEVERLVVTHASTPVQRYWRRQQLLARLRRPRATSRG